MKNVPVFSHEFFFEFNEIEILHRKIRIKILHAIHHQLSCFRFHFIHERLFRCEYLEIFLSSLTLNGHIFLYEKIPLLLFIKRRTKVLIYHENLFLQLHLLKTWNEKSMYLFLRCSFSAFSTKQQKTLSKEKNLQFWVSIKLVFVIVHPLLCSLLCLFTCNSKIFIFLFVNVLVSLNIALCKYLVFSVSVWFH